MPSEDSSITGAISKAMIGLYARTYGKGSTTARTFINENVVVCVLNDILSPDEATLVAHGGDAEVIGGRIAFQEDCEDEFTEAVERITGRKVVAFLSANQAVPGVACEMFFLDRPPEVEQSRLQMVGDE